MVYCELQMLVSGFSLVRDTDTIYGCIVPLKFSNFFHFYFLRVLLCLSLVFYCFIVLYY